MGAMFAERARWDLTPNRLTTLLAAKRRAGVAILDLTESNPTRAGLMAPTDLLAALAHASAARYDPTPLGLAATRAAVATDYRRRGVEVAPEHVLLTASTSEAYAFLFKLLCDPGDVVLIPRPSYPLFEHLAGLEAVGCAAYALAHDGEWHIDFGDLERQLASAPRARAIVVVHPNNPTGSYVKRDEAERLHDLAASRGLALVADEVFADFSFRDDARRQPSFAVEGPALAFTLGGLSKCCGLPQLKLGWVVTSGPASLRREALARLEMVADTFRSVGTPVQVAAPEILARLPDLQRPLAERVHANLAELERQAPRAPAASVLSVEGGWYAILRVPATLSEEQRVLQLLEAHDVLVHPGFFFDFPAEAYLVLSLLPEPAVFAEGLRRLLGAL